MEQNKHIWIINQYAGTPQTSNPGRHFSIAQVLQRLGYKVTIITASFTHGRWNRNVTDKISIKRYKDIEYIWIKVPQYTNHHGLGRIRNWFIFSYMLTQIKHENISLPDVIYYSSLSLVGYLGAENLKKTFKVPLVFEVRDIWPLTLQELKNIPPYHPFVLFLKRIEMRAYKESDLVISNLSNFDQYLIDEKLENIKSLWIPNGFDSEEEIEYLEYTGLPKKNEDVFRVGYAGSLGLANNMKAFIMAANSLKDHNDIEFYILGDGPEKEKLMNMSANKNIHFLSKVPKKQVRSFLEQMDCCYIGSNSSKLYRYGIGANKISDYIQIKKPIVFSYSGYGDPITNYELGLTVPSDNVTKLQEAFLKIKDLPESKKKQIEINSSSVLDKYYDYNKTVALLDKKICEIVKKS